MEELFMLLNSIYPLSEGLIEHLYKVVKSKTLAKKDFLLQAGQISRRMCYINKGLLRAFYMKDDIEVSSWFMKEGDIIVSIDSFYGQTPSYESIQALEDVEIIYIDYSELEYVYKTFMEFNYIGRILTIKYLRLWVSQLNSIRNQSAQERYKWLVKNHPEIVLRVPAKYIASYLDITEVTLSRIKGNVTKKKT